MALVVDPNTGRLVDEKELGRTKQQQDNKKDINETAADIERLTYKIAGTSVTGRR